MFCYGAASLRQSLFSGAGFSLDLCLSAAKCLLILLSGRQVCIIRRCAPYLLQPLVLMSSVSLVSCDLAAAVY